MVDESRFDGFKVSSLENKNSNLKTLALQNLNLPTLDELKISKTLSKHTLVEVPSDDEDR
jgi:hypothetical protein